MFAKILIANRDKIACRVIKTARRFYAVITSRFTVSPYLASA
jgi:acetyl/propionyl-CoA carboxylase alpha subunit